MLNDSTDNIRLDINNEKVRACVYVRKGDTKVRTLHITLADNGRVVSLENAICAEILIAKADGYKTDQGAVVVGNEIQYTLRTQDIAAVGENFVQVCVTFDDGAQITSANFSLMVYEKNVDSRTLTSTNEYTALGQMVADARAYANSASGAADLSSNTLEEMESKMDDFDGLYVEYITNMEGVKADTEQYKIDTETYAIESKGHSDNAKLYSEYAAEHSELALEQALAAKADASLANDAKDVVEADKDLVEGIKASIEEIENSIEQSKAVVIAYESAASASASDAGTYADSASTSESNAADYENGAKEYYEMTKEIAGSVSGGGLIPCGTIAPAQIAAQLPLADTGYMYNINGEFTTDDTFEEGAGITYPAGNNIYKTNDGKWDVLSGKVVSGVKGNAEGVYRQGNINITAENIGLGNVDNTADEDKPISSAQEARFSTIEESVASVEEELINVADDVSALTTRVGNAEDEIARVEGLIPTIPAWIGYPYTPN